MKKVRSPFYFILLLLVIIAGQFAVFSSGYFSFSKTLKNFSKQELALKKAAVQNNQIYCLKHWKAQFKPMPLLPHVPEQSVLTVSLDPHLISFHQFDFIFSVKGRIFVFNIHPQTSFPQILIEPPRV